MMKSILYNKQCVGKAETSFNIRLNKVDAVMTWKHFQQESHNFVDQLTNTSKFKETLTQRLIKRENFSILKLDTLYPKGFNKGISK